MTWSAVLLALALPTQAGTLEGVTLPDSATVGGEPLVLKGMGLREKYLIDVYVAGMYLPAKTTDANKAITDDVSKRIVMHMVRDLSKEQLVDSIQEAAALQKLSAEQKQGIATVTSWMGPVQAGQQVIMDYTPGQGVTVTVAGKKSGPAGGKALMEVLWRIYLGSTPVTAALKKGLLGR